MLDCWRGKCVVVCMSEAPFVIILIEGEVSFLLYCTNYCDISEGMPGPTNQLLQINIHSIIYALIVLFSMKK